MSDYREIGFGEGDMELEQEQAVELREKEDRCQRGGLDLVEVDAPPAGFAICVCGYCHEVKSAAELGWQDERLAVYVCDQCADATMERDNRSL